MQTPAETFEEVQFPPPLPARLEGPPPANIQRPGKPLSNEIFGSLFDTEGRLVDEHRLRHITFTGGIEPGVRKRAWQFLFELYPFHSTEREREVMLADYHAKYTALKDRWRAYLQQNAPDTTQDPSEEKLLSPGYLQTVPKHCELSAEHSEDPPSPTQEVQQQWQFMQLQAKVHAGREPLEQKPLVSAIRIIDKDVPRTDRNTEFFRGADNPHLRVLRDILITYAAFHPQIGYAQGMNDILARFLIVLRSEVEAYWCFTHYMEHMKADFVEDGVLNKLRDVQQLLQELDPELLRYLTYLQLGDMTFCHRWMLLCFKREFSEEDSLRVFEMLSSHHLELTSMHAQRQYEQERRKEFQHKGGKTRLAEAPVNQNLTFDVFLCVSVLLQYRTEMFQCEDTAAVFALISSLTMKLSLDQAMEKSEQLFYQYCSKSVSDCFEVVDLPSPPSRPTNPFTKYSQSSHS